MGTIVNGNKWSGVVVNGNIITGLAKNGFVFYKKPIELLYKRRIMVGDDLSGKTIYQDFTKNYYVNNTSEWEQMAFPIIIDERLNFGIRTNILSTNPQEYVVQFETREQSSSYLYKYDGSKEEFKNVLNLGSSYSSVVKSISDGVTYRHLFIEDENIRPVQVGDVITSNTKFYFTFPDDFKSFITSPILSSKLIIQLDNSNTGFRVDDSYLDSSAVMATIANKFGYTLIRPFIYEYENDTNTLLQNGSYRINIRSNSNESFSGTVTYIDKTDSAYQHILVDATTLGA